MNDKLFNIILTIAAVALVIYGVFTMTDKKDSKDDNKDNKQIKFNYKDELSLVDDIILDNDFKFNDDLKLKIALSNISSEKINNTKSSFNDVDNYTFTGKYINESDIENYLIDLFGKNNYELKSFYYDNNWYLYDSKDKCFYIFTSTLVTNCVNSSDVATNCIDFDHLCDTKYKKDNNSVVVNVYCTIGIQYDRIDYYSYKYIYSYNKNTKDYYISDIKLIKE